MALDGTLLFGTTIDNSGFNSGIGNLQLIADNAIGNIVSNIASSAANAVSQIPTQMVAVGSGFEAAMSQVAATSGITAASEDYKKLAAAAKDMGATTQFSASQAAEALNYLALAGYDANKSIATLPTILNVAASDGMELAAASDMITDAMSALGLQMDEVNTFANKLAVAAQKSNASVSQMGEAILTVGGTAKDLSGGVTELTTMLGVLADNGIKGAEGGTALRNMILSLSAPTNTASEALNALEVSAFNADGSMRPLQDTFADLSAALSDLSAEDRNKILSDIFNKVDLKSANALLGTSAERFSQLSGYIDDCDGAAEQMAKTMNDNLKGDITILQSGLEGLGIAAYDKFAQPMRSAVQNVTEDVSDLTDSLKDGALEDSFDTISTGFEKIVSGGAEALANFILPNLIKGFGWVVSNFDLVSAAAGAATVTVISYKIATEGATVAQVAFNAAANLNPYVLIGSAIAGTVAAIGIFVAAQDNAAEIADKAQQEYIKQATAVEELNKQLEENQSRLEELEEINMPTYADRQEIANIQDMNEELKIQLAIEKEILATRQTEAENTAVDSLNIPMEAYRNKLSEYEKDIQTMQELQDKYNNAVALGDSETAMLYEGYISNMQSTLDDEKAILLTRSDEINSLAKNLHGFTDNGKKAQESIAGLNKELYETLGLGKQTNSSIFWNGNDTAAYEKSKYEKGVGAAAKAYSDEATALSKAQADATEKLKSEWKSADHNYAIGIIGSEQELYAEKKRIWSEYGDTSLEDHWSYYEELAEYQTKFYDEATDAEKKAMEAKWKAIANQENLGLITNEDAYKQRQAFIDEYCPIYADEWSAYYQEIYDYQQNEAAKSLELEKDNLNARTDALKDNLNGILSAYKNAYNELSSQKASYKSKLLSVGDAFGVTENEDGSKTAKVNDLREQMSEMKKYHAYIKKLKAEGVSSALLRELVSMDFEEGMVFAENLSAMSADELGEINGYYNEKEKLAQSLSDELYQPETDALNTQLGKDITAQYSALPPELQTIGADAYNAFIAGMQDASSDVSEQVKTLTDSLDNTFTTAISNMDLTTSLTEAAASTDAYSIGQSLGDDFAAGFAAAITAAEATVKAEQAAVTADYTVKGKPEPSAPKSSSGGTEKIVIENKINTQLNVDGRKLAATTETTQNTVNRERGI